MRIANDNISNKFNDFSLPNQRVSDKAKQQKKWFIPTGRYVIEACISANPNKNKQAILYNVANGIINEDEYKYVTNPFHSDNAKLKHFPAKMRNHDIIKPILLRHIGEYLKTSFKVIVGVNNADVENRKMEAKLLKMQPYIDELLTAILDKKTDVNNQQEQQAAINKLEEAQAKFDDNWLDKRAIQGQQVLDYLRDSLDLDSKYVTSYVDWLISSQFYTHTDVRHDRVTFESISPLEYYPVMNNSDYTEDNNMGMRKYKMSIYDIQSEFSELLDDKDVKFIKDIMINNSSSNGRINVSDAIKADRFGNAYEFFKQTYGASHNENVTFTDNDSLVWVYHYVWTTETKVQVLVYQDGLGQMQKKEVSVDYELNEAIGDIALESKYVNEVLEGYRFGEDVLGLYTKPRTIATQRHELNNTSSVKIPYGGKTFMYNGLMSASIIEPLVPYQVIFNILHYYRELAIAKNKGKLMILPKGLLSDDAEVSQADAIHYMKADGTVWLDETSDNFTTAISGIKAVDLSDSAYIVGLSNILREIKEEAWDLVGMNRQRYGDTMASEGKGTTEQAIYRASVSTAPITETFNAARMKGYMGLLDNAKVAYLSEDETKTLGSYINGDGRLEYLTIAPKEFLESDLGVYVASFTRDKDKIEQYKQVAFAASQNGAFELGIEAIEFENPHKLKSILKEYRKLEDQRTQAQQEARQQELKLAQERDDAKFKEQEDTKRYIADVNKESAVEVATIKADIANVQKESANVIADKKANTERYKADLKTTVDKDATANKTFTEMMKARAISNRKDK